VSILRSVPSVTMMISGEFHDWAMRALEKEIVRNTPAAKARRAFLSAQRESKRELGKAKRSLASKHAAQSRGIRKRQVEAELALRKRESEREAEMAERRWRLLMGNR